MPGYSGTPLAKKLGIKPGFHIFVDNGPADYVRLLEPLPDDVSLVPRPARNLDMIHLFTKQARELEAKLPKYMQTIVSNGMIWVSWPKKAAKIETDVTEDVVRDLALPLGLVDTKVCAVDDVWSGLRLVIRVELRKQ
ncbi:MAG: DUF3052 family protein [Planctomycetota bacterium]|nr:MAG: DUF3052 family protein [Planctomycetota bacterium]